MPQMPLMRFAAMSFSLLKREIEQVIAGIAKSIRKLKKSEQTVPILKKRLFVRTARLQFWKQLLSITTETIERLKNDISLLLTRVI